MDNQEIKTKRCSKCGRFLPLADFNKCSSASDGLQNYCKDCQKEMYAEYRVKNKVKIEAYRQANKEKIKAMKKEYYQSNKDAILKKNAEYYQAHKEEKKVYQAQYCKKNKQANAQKQAEWHQENTDVDTKTKRCPKCGRVLPITEFHKDNSRKNGVQSSCKDCQKAMKAEWYNQHPTYDTERCDPQTHPLNWAKNMVNGYRRQDRVNGFGDKDTISLDYFIQHIANEPCAHCGTQGYGLIGCNRLDNTKGHTIDNVEPCCPSCNFSQNILDQIRRGVHVSCKGKARHKTA